MDIFRAKTLLWTESVDADTNFRPIQKNPSCISNCWTSGGSEDLEYCRVFGAARRRPAAVPQQCRRRPAASLQSDPGKREIFRGSRLRDSVVSVEVRAA